MKLGERKKIIISQEALHHLYNFMNVWNEDEGNEGHLDNYSDAILQLVVEHYKYDLVIHSEDPWWKDFKK